MPDKEAAISLGKSAPEEWKALSGSDQKKQQPQLRQEDREQERKQPQQPAAAAQPGPTPAVPTEASVHSVQIAPYPAQAPPYPIQVAPYPVQVVPYPVQAAPCQTAPVVYPIGAPYYRAIWPQDEGCCESGSDPVGLQLCLGCLSLLLAGLTGWAIWYHFTRGYERRDTPWWEEKE